MISIDVMRISCESIVFDCVDRILNVQRSSNDEIYWEYAINNDDTDIYYIDAFLPLLQDKYQELERIGIFRENITIWRYYKHEGQCNFEFHPDEMKQLADNGIVLHVSCWE